MSNRTDGEWSTETYENGPGHIERTERNQEKDGGLLRQQHRISTGRTKRKMAMIPFGEYANNCNECEMTCHTR